MTAPPFWPQPSRKPAFALADADALTGVAALRTIRQAPAQSVAPQPPSEVRRPATPALERLRRRLKTISRDELQKQTETKKTRSQKKTAKQDVSAKKARPLFLNRIVNSIGDLLGIAGSPDKGKQEETRKTGAGEGHASAAPSLPGDRDSAAALADTAPPPAVEDLNPFHPAAIPKGARLADAFGARRGQGDGDAPPPDLAEPLTRLEETKTKAAVPAPPVEQQLARISSETQSVERARVYTPKPDGTMPLKRLRRPLTDIQLSLGESVTTGQPQLPRGLAEPQACITKQQGQVKFCIVPVDWPEAMEEAFSVNTLLYQGTRAIARYDAGKTSHLHTLFDSQYYQDVRAHLMRRFGPPTDRWARTIAPFFQQAAPAEPDPGLAQPRYAHRYRHHSGTAALR